MNTDLAPGTTVYWREFAGEGQRGFVVRSGEIVKVLTRIAGVDEVIYLIQWRNFFGALEETQQRASDLMLQDPGDC